jgi:hypothetical protein
VIAGTVAELSFLGDHIEARLATAGSDIGVRLHPSHHMSPGDVIRLQVAPRDVMLLTS